MADIVFVPNEPGIRSLYIGDASPVVRHMRSKANRVEQLAKIQVGKGSGRLAQSIKARPTEYTPTGDPFIRIGSHLNYALLHHSGTRPHQIRSNSGGMLRFNTRRGQVFATVVRHPGTRPNLYLTTPLRTVMASG